MDERVADELDGHPAVPVDLLLEWKDDEDTIGDLANRLQAARAPPPDLRADVIHDRDAQALHAPRERKVEIRKADDDDAVRPLADSAGGDAPNRRIRSLHPRHAVDQAGHRTAP